MVPEEYDTPLYWGEEERRHLAGTNVLLLTTVRRLTACVYPTPDKTCTLQTHTLTPTPHHHNPR